MSAAENGARVVLIERGSAVGGELISGLPYLSVANIPGDWIVGGPLRTLLDMAAVHGGYAGRPFDGRGMWGACIDPEVMKLVVVQALAERGVEVLVGCGVTDVIARDGRVHGLITMAKSGRLVVEATTYVDASGDGDVVMMAGGEVIKGDVDGTLQPVSLTFRMSHVDYGAFLQWLGSHPEQFNLAENPAIGKSAQECADGIVASGDPFCVLDGQRADTILGAAIASGDMFATTAVWMWPTSTRRGELGFNTTRLAGIDGTDSAALGTAAAVLAGQVHQVCNFMVSRLPGFDNAQLSGVAPKVGIRETRRIVGLETLATDDVVAARKRPDGIGRGSHHVDIHGSGTDQERCYITGGGSYDIPYGALVPVGLTNVLAAGRCLSSSRAANGSARVIGSCMATGQAAGTAAAMAVAHPVDSLVDIDVEELRGRIGSQGGVVSGPA